VSLNGVVAKRGYVCSIPLYKIFNYILYRLHTGCQWERLPIHNDHNDALELKDNLRAAFKFIKRLGIVIAGSYFNTDAAFDTNAARKVCFNHNVIPNLAENKRSPNKTKCGPKRLFNPEVYTLRCSSERTFA
jgi:hypothetical protein